MLLRPERWQRPYADAPLTDENLEEALRVPALAALDADAFPGSEPLSDILRYDARIRRFSEDDVVMLAGEYGHSVFFILEGSLRIVLDQTTPFKRESQYQDTLWAILKRFWHKPRGRERRDPELIDRDQARLRTRSSGSMQLLIRGDDPWLQGKQTVELSRGDMFGEIAALIRSPRTATVIANGPLRVLEMRWQGFRDIRRFDPGFKQVIDTVYKERSLKSQLAESPLFSHLDDETLKHIAEQTLYETYGGFEWYSRFKHQDEQTALASEPVIIEQGAYLNGLILISTGFARLSVRQDSGQRTIDYASANEVFGWQEIVGHWRHGYSLASRYSLRALGYTDILIVPTAVILEHVLPGLDPRFIDQSVEKEQRKHPGETEGMNQAMLDYLVDKRIMNGTSTMFINTDRCVGCDDCVRACASAHGDNPRFVRQGERAGHWSVINACMHCVDPVCLIGCPTGAIQRAEESGQVVINEAACVGCETCANSCPYDNIRMVDIYDDAGDPLRDDQGRALRKASKCDLCIDLPAGPACVRACPHDALERVDMRDREAVIVIGSE